MSSLRAMSGSGSTMIVEAAPLNVAKSTSTGCSGLPARVWTHAARTAGSASGPPGAVMAAAFCRGPRAVPPVVPAAGAANAGELAAAANVGAAVEGAASTAAGADEAAGAGAAAVALALVPNWVSPGKSAAAPGTLLLTTAAT